MSWAVTFPALEPLVKPAISTIEDKQGICSHKVGDAGLEKVARRYARDSAYVHGTMFGQSQKIFDLSQNLNMVRSQKHDEAHAFLHYISLNNSTAGPKNTYMEERIPRLVFFTESGFAIHYQLQDPLVQQAKLTSDSIRLPIKAKQPCLVPDYYL